MQVNLMIVCARNPDLDSVYDHRNHCLISGIVTKMDVSIPCRVRLYEKLSGRLIADVLTDRLGNYRFSGLSRTAFFIVAHDPATQYNAVIQDNVVPK